MSDFSKLFGQMMEQGQKMAASVNPDMTNFTPEGFDKLFPTMSKEHMDMLWGNAFNKDGLDARTRLLVVIAGMTAQGVPAEAAFESTLHHALEAGATEKEIAEVIYQMSLLGGIPSMSKALDLAREVFSTRQEDSA